MLFVLMLLGAVVYMVGHQWWGVLQQQPPPSSSSTSSVVVSSGGMWSSPSDQPPLRSVWMINQPTNIGAVADAPYRQQGVLSPANSTSKDSIMLLMGRPLLTNRDKWLYYAVSNQFNQVRLPVTCKGKSCTSEYGCDRLDSGDTVYVEGSNEVYRVTLYDTDYPRYIPL